MGKKIGEVFSVTGAYISVEVSPEISDLHLRYNGKSYVVGQPGTYLVVDSGHDKHLILVTTVRKMVAKYALENTTHNPLSSLIPENNYPIPREDELIDRTIIDGILVGTIVGNKFEVGIYRLPVVGDSVTITSEKQIKIALAPQTGRHSFSIGCFPDSPNAVSIDLDHLLGKHTAIVGTTGCGKSYSIARMINTIINDYPSSNIIVFDLHGEYRNCFDSCNYLRADKLELPAWLHSFEDLFELCADLSGQFNIHNQRLCFREGIFQLKQRYCKDILKDDDLSQKLDLDAPIPFDFEKFLNYMHNLNNQTLKKGTNESAIKDGSGSDIFNDRIGYESQSTNYVKGPFKGDLDRLVLRIESRKKDPRYSFMFAYNPSGRDDLVKIMEKISGLTADNPKNVTIFDLSYLPSETVGSVVASISRILFQIYFLSDRRKFIPTLVVYEEAHNYIARKGRGAYGEARESVERIAKEGRKFGIGTIVVSQRPSELSETLLSQCNTFLCMRLANSVDKSYIESLLPNSMNHLVDILPALPRGHILAIGQATKMPVRFVVSEIEEPKMRPDSDDPPFGKLWGEKMDKRSIPDLRKVCDLWVKSEKPDHN